ncbi:hypothetical protein [Archangium sp.]|uniref:hypothetical protein n=1 Tax=Archangium sp. TaxID=1872627 RepID=UPI002D630DCE|nr:hypothetical protein [Archangium sp.]HYO52052.1 hypothetical protein [Archangium sp.]
MNRVRVAAWVLVLMLEAGCPVGGEAGVLHQTMLKDEMKRLARDSCRPADVEAMCGPDDFDECMAACRMAMEKRGRK